MTDRSCSVIGRASTAADRSYAEKTTVQSDEEDFEQTGRYTVLSRLYTLGLVTTMSKREVEISDLPLAFQDSRWTFYLDDGPGGCRRYITEYLNDLMENETIFVVVRPDGYVGTVWSSAGSATDSVQAAELFLDEYFEGFLSV